MKVMNVKLMDALHAARDEVVTEASQALARGHLPHYEAAGAEESRDRLAALLALVSECLEQESLVPISRYAQTVAEERFRAGFDVGEVQTGFNVLEEAIWHVVIRGLPGEELAEATGLVGTVLGAGKDALARTWVSLAAEQHVTSLDLSALFLGAGS
jgi:hypothetical protein